MLLIGRAPAAAAAAAAAARLPPPRATPRAGASCAARRAPGAAMESDAWPAQKQLGAQHYCLDQADSRVQRVAAHLPWYGPTHSPHDVPRFYDISGITEDCETFQLVIDLFVRRYRAMGADGPTHVAGFDARGFVFGPPIALALGIPFVMIRKKGKLPGVLVSSGKYKVRERAHPCAPTCAPQPR